MPTTVVACAAVGWLVWQFLAPALSTMAPSAKGQAHRHLLLVQLRSAFVLALISVLFWILVCASVVVLCCCRCPLLRPCPPSHLCYPIPYLNLDCNARFSNIEWWRENIYTPRLPAQGDWQSTSRRSRTALRWRGASSGAREVSPSLRRPPFGRGRGRARRGSAERICSLRRKSPLQAGGGHD